MIVVYAYIKNFCRIIHQVIKPFVHMMNRTHHINKDNIVKYISAYPKEKFCRAVSFKVSVPKVFQKFNNGNILL
jgi:hypothetical protein